MIAFIAPPLPHGYLPIGHRRGCRWIALLTLTIFIANVPGRLSAPHFRRQGPPLTGRIHIVGSRGLAAPVARWALIFRREHPAVHVTTALFGSGIAVGALASGFADVAPLSRPLGPREWRLLADAGSSAWTVEAKRGASPIYLYLGSPAGRPTPLAIEFARIALSREGQQGLHAPHLASFASPIPRTP